MSITECLTSIENELQNDFRERKLYSRHLYKSYQRLYKNGFNMRFDFEKRYMNVKNCVTFPEFNRYKSGLVKLGRADFCKDKLCPMCAWRRSKKIYHQVHTCVDYLKKDYQFIMLTLTVPNVSGSQLSDEIDHLNKSFAKMLNYKVFKRICKGYLKCLEITYSSKLDNFHPHFHVLIAVDKNYFKSDDYLKQPEFLAMWKKATKNNNVSQVDVRKIHSNPNQPERSTISSAVAEVAKYAVKPADYIRIGNPMLTDKLVYTFSTVLYNRRLISWGGVLADTRKMFGFDDAVDGDLLHTDGETAENDEVVAVYKYRWTGGKYKLYDIEYSKNFILVDNVSVNADTGEVVQE